jgi:hypothetical protein
MLPLPLRLGATTASLSFRKAEYAFEASTAFTLDIMKGPGAATRPPARPHANRPPEGRRVRGEASSQANEDNEQTVRPGTVKQGL